MGDVITVNFTDAASFKIDSIGNATSASISLEVLSNSGGSMAINQQPSKSNGFTAEFQVTGRQWRGWVLYPERPFDRKIVGAINEE